ncbi:MAG: lipid-binding SYLF domain-containing protein [Deltaproteobacteria bacterium]|nr:lipid-binding SYLF domain-containing protein [Deltaproteobacteria bacterium]
MKRNEGSKFTFRLAVSLFVTAIFFVTALPAMAKEDLKLQIKEDLKPQILVDQALVTLNDFVSEKDMEWFKNNLKDSKGILIIPQLLKAGFIFGGSGGRAVVLIRDPKTGQWSQPGFYSVGSVSFGLQIGAESAAVIMQVRTQRGLESLYGTSFKLGGDCSVAAGPVGIGVSGKGVTGDLISFSRAQGAYAGISFDGSMIKVNEGFDKDYYGKPVRPVDIFVKKDVSNQGSEDLRNALEKAEKEK